MNLRNRLLLFLLTCSVFIAVSSLEICIAQDSSSASADPLAPFARLIGGKWYLGETSQVFEWGVGKKIIISSSYFVSDKGEKLVSQGNWFWHPGEKQLKGYFVAIDMPVAFFDYTTRFEGNKMINALKSYTPKGKLETYSEIFEFTSDNEYQWTLYSETPTGAKKVMEGKFIRKQ